ncbi:NAD(P)-dependent alcohol dehydrogenase [bacterium]|nr:NAD(P)-dependent alcohol dehydrogenase [bacterium]
MRAFVQTAYGGSGVIEPRELAKPVPQEGEVVVRVQAASLAAGDVFMMRGTPFPARFSIGFPTPKKDHLVGLDFAGVIEAVGPGVADFAAGDTVYGECFGSCAEYARARAARIARMPRNMTFAEAAGVPTSACAALQGLRDQAKVRPGMHVLINGASGGVGPFAVQIAKALGVEVTGVCSTGNVELVRSLGADHVIDYTQEDFTRGGRRYDVIFDNVASHPLAEARRALKPGGIHVPSSGHGGMRWIIAASLAAPLNRQQGKPFLALTLRQDLEALAEMIDAGAVRTVVDRVYPLDDVPAAFGYLDQGHARGKVIIDVAGGAS